MIWNHLRPTTPTRAVRLVALSSLLAMTGAGPASVQAESDPDTWRIAYHFFAPAGEPAKGSLSSTSRSSLPGFSFTPPAEGSWELVLKSASMQVMTSTPSKTIKKTKHSVVAMATAIAGGETFLERELLEKRLQQFTEAGGPFEFVESRGPERLNDGRDCLRFGLTSLDHRQLRKMPSPLETTAEILDCRHPTAESYHAILVFSERRPPASDLLGSEAAINSFFDSLQFTDITDPAIVERVPLKKGTVQVRSDAGVIWATIPDRSAVMHWAPSSGEEPKELIVGGSPAFLASAEGALWVSATSGSISRIDPDLRKRVHELSVGGTPGPMTDGGGAIWILDYENQAIDRLDPQSNQVTRQIAVGEGQQKMLRRNKLRAMTFRRPTFGLLSDLAFHDGALWVADHGRSRVFKVDPETGEKVGAPISVSKGPASLLIADGSLWTVNRDDGSLTRIDVSSGTVSATIPVCFSPLQATRGPRWIWVSCQGDSTVVRVDPSSQQLVGEPIPVGGGPFGIAADEDSVWVAQPSGYSLARIRLDSLTTPN